MREHTVRKGRERKRSPMRDETRNNSDEIPNPKNRNSGNFVESNSCSHGYTPSEKRVSQFCFCFRTIECNVDEQKTHTAAYLLVLFVGIELSERNSYVS